MTYSKATTAWKVTGVVMLVFGAVGGVIVGTPLPADLDTLKSTWPAFVFGLAFALKKAVENIRKNYLDDGSPLWVWPWSRTKKEDK